MGFYQVYPYKETLLMGFWDDSVAHGQPRARRPGGIRRFQTGSALRLCGAR